VNSFYGLTLQRNGTCASSPINRVHEGRGRGMTPVRDNRVAGIEDPQSARSAPRGGHDPYSALAARAVLRSQTMTRAWPPSGTTPRNRQRAFRFLDDSAIFTAMPCRRGHSSGGMSDPQLARGAH